MQLGAAGHDLFSGNALHGQAQKMQAADAQILGEAARIEALTRAEGQVATTQLTYGRAPDGSSYITSVTITRTGASQQAKQPLQQAMEDITPARLPLWPSDMAEGFSARMEAAAHGIAEALATQELRHADAGVRNHEGLHFRVAGGLAVGLPELEYVQGPDGQYYAVAGEVRVSTGATADAEKASRDAATYARAATAPGDVSAQDMSAARGAFAHAADTYGKALAGWAMPASGYDMIA